MCIVFLGKYLISNKGNKLLWLKKEEKTSVSGRGTLLQSNYFSPIINILFVKQ